VRVHTGRGQDTCISEQAQRTCRTPTASGVDGVKTVREGVIAPFLAFIPDNGFKTVCQMKWVISITLPQSESIIPTTSERSSAPLCLELNTKVDIKGEKGKP